MPGYAVEIGENHPRVPQHRQVPGGCPEWIVRAFLGDDHHRLDSQLNLFMNVLHAIAILIALYLRSTWVSGAPENLAKARILRHSESMEGRPQSPDQASNSILRFSPQ